MIGRDHDDIGLDGNSLDLGGHIIDRDVTRRTSLRSGNKIFNSLVVDTNQIVVPAPLIQGIMSADVGRSMGYFSQTGLHIN